ncbi:RAVE protein 1 C terminal-domain-containing protein [Suillus clintonianus]|uniref:RAVE protein 1 C terminal-domain-containing protein n=1 Tax=Suillus clintonianus TaxID=1904413 RepID=UPI001B876311|nr:RAVE protein 1 C terminal-domain-containing protein [Suillus clintonianus]KAG2154690.1 RAVE protein 1 C terminal-domain-containing protein [Suillus clintonianus]
MLDLLNTFTGCPVGALHRLVLPHVTLILYPSADSIVILDANTLNLVRVLAFGEIYPSTQHLNQTISGVAVDSAMKVIVASMDTHIAAWSLSGIQNDAWRIHSSISLQDGDVVTALDCRSGLLSVGSKNGLSVYTLILENDLLTWSKKWEARVATPSLAKFAPTLAFIATTSHHDNLVRLYSTTSGRLVQGIPHPRPVTDLMWRFSQASRSDDPALYTITSDSTLRIFLPVIDAPHRLQLHASLDLFSSLPFLVAAKLGSHPRKSTVVWLDKEVVRRTIKAVLALTTEDASPQVKRLREIDDEGWDLFVRALGDGSMLVSAVANIDRRPPTLIRQFALSHTSSNVLSQLPSYLYLFPHPDVTCLTMVTSTPLTTFKVSPLAFFDGQSAGLHLNAKGLDRLPHEESKIRKLVRTPAGRGVAVVRADGGEVWRVVEGGSQLARGRRWSDADHVVVLDGGELVATYSSETSVLTLHSDPISTLTLPSIIDLFSAPSKTAHECIVGLTSDSSIVYIHIDNNPNPTLRLHSQNNLPLAQPPKLILPVDPMSWSRESSLEEHDTLLSISDDGELSFWIAEEGTSSGWRCTGKVKTGRKNFALARCSSAKKSVLVVRLPDGQELTIWDSKESEFASGLEHRRIFSTSEPINDFDWTSTPDNQSILAVGFTHHIELLCQQRKTYFNDDPAWAICWKVDIRNYISYPIRDSIWLAHGSFLIAAGHQLFLFGQTALQKDQEPLFQYIARQNGPLEDYHPQMLLQCLLWGKVELVKQIIVALSRVVDAVHEDPTQDFHWNAFPVEHYLRGQHMISNKKPSKRYNLLFSAPQENLLQDEIVFSRHMVETLIEQLEARPLPHLTPNEHAHLLVLIQTTLEIEEQRRALDANGLRYVISMRSFYILNRRVTSDPSSPRSNGAIPRSTGWRERLRYRDMVWAFHSESQGLLLSTSTAACNGRMLWPDARALGVFIWLNSVESLRAHMEVIARNEYMAGDNRDPTACSLFYFALGKVKLVHGLWKQAAWHKEQAIMLKFLANDFTQPKRKTAALKNAYALLSKQRFEYAAAFFLLGGSLKDAVHVCIRHLSDFQLAIALARVVEGGSDGPVLRDILHNTVIPTAFREGNRWLGSWAFWMLNRRDLAVRILVTPLRDIADALDIQVAEIGEPHYDDPSLALLFSQLRSKTLQTAKGTSEISGRSEFNFVLQIARVFCRMGCHALALDLVRSWSFERPSISVVAPIEPPPTPYATLRRSLALDHNLRRRSSIMIDMDIATAPPTRKASPERSLVKVPTQETIKEESDLLARKAGLGSLIKSAKQDVQVPEFSMDSFFDP